MLFSLLKIVAGYKVKSYIEDHTPIGSLRKSFIDNVVRERVVPINGSILYCSFFGAEHTGVYVGNNKIVELLGSGEIRISSPEMFISGTNAVSIYVACDSTDPLGGDEIAVRAKRMAGRSRNYNLVLDNCHQFTSGCISGDFENADNYFLLVENKIERAMNNGASINWRVWER